ncbi:MAG: hypothetical protein LBM01_01850 [Christensenellaceae bacterium]|jgi:hypothetical protein|nr:hypothetical protein [Christensenellaceae bacterium]
MKDIITGDQKIYRTDKEVLCVCIIDRRTQKQDTYEVDYDAERDLQPVIMETQSAQVTIGEKYRWDYYTNLHPQELPVYIQNIALSDITPKVCIIKS